ncbi:MAG: DUF4352 domain-containing protein [Acidobacteria bacterium]|nr:DUF4352 domain-containing protein [Acidobacteriota bacterium]
MNRMSVRRLALLVLGAVALSPSLALTGCRSGGPQDRPYRMGELVIVGALRYTIFDTEWKTQIGEGPGAHTPRNRYLIIHLSITNSGGSLLEVPTLTLERADGAADTAEPEIADSLGVPDWMGVIRRLKPADTVQGKVIFDVPLSAYRLRVGGGADVADEKSAVVDIPIQYTPATDPATGQPLGSTDR